MKSRNAADRDAVLCRRKAKSSFIAATCVGRPSTARRRPLVDCKLIILRDLESELARSGGRLERHATTRVAHEACRLRRAKKNSAICESAPSERDGPRLCMRTIHEAGRGVACRAICWPAESRGDQFAATARATLLFWSARAASNYASSCLCATRASDRCRLAALPTASHQLTLPKDRLGEPCGLQSRCMTSFLSKVGSADTADILGSCRQPSSRSRSVERQLPFEPTATLHQTSSVTGRQSCRLLRERQSRRSPP